MPAGLHDLSDVGRQLTDVGAHLAGAHANHHCFRVRLGVDVAIDGSRASRIVGTRMGSSLGSSARHGGDVVM